MVTSATTYRHLYYSSSHYDHPHAPPPFAFTVQCSHSLTCPSDFVRGPIVCCNHLLPSFHLCPSHLATLGSDFHQVFSPPFFHLSSNLLSSYDLPVSMTFIVQQGSGFRTDEFDSAFAGIPGLGHYPCLEEDILLVLPRYMVSVPR